MKRILGLLSLVTLFATSSCKKDDVNVTALPDPVESAIIEHIFNIGGSSTNNVGPTLLPGKKLTLRSIATNFPINETLNFSQPGETGGTVTVTGTMTGLVSDTGNSTIAMNMTEAFQNFGMMVDGKNYTSTGNILFKGNMVMNNSAQTASASYTIGGSLALAGENYSKTTAMQLVIEENVKGSSISMSVKGTVGGKTVNYSETLNMQ